MISSSGTSHASTGESNHEPIEVKHQVASALSRHDRESRAIDFIRAIESLDDQDLLKRMRGIVVKERRSTTQLLAHLAVLDGRRLYIAQGYSSLFNYCTRGLHFSEQAAYLRIEAARVVRRFPIVLARVADGSIHLTAMSLLRPHLTTDNHRQLFDAACHRSRREIEDLVSIFRSSPTGPSRPRFDVVPPLGQRESFTQPGAGRIPPATASLPFHGLVANQGPTGRDPNAVGPLPAWWPPGEDEVGDTVGGGRNSGRDGSDMEFNGDCGNESNLLGGGSELLGGGSAADMDGNDSGGPRTPGSESPSYRPPLDHFRGNETEAGTGP